jgi:hypothetical protein
MYGSSEKMSFTWNVSLFQYVRPNVKPYYIVPTKSFPYKESQQSLTFSKVSLPCKVLPSIFMSDHFFNALQQQNTEEFSSSISCKELP